MKLVPDISLQIKEQNKYEIFEKTDLFVIIIIILCVHREADGWVYLWGKVKRNCDSSAIERQRSSTGANTERTLDLPLTAPPHNKP